MNFAYVHLILNHLPIVGIPIALSLISFGMFKRNAGIQRSSLFILAVVAAFSLPIYFTGEPAEHVVEHLPGVAKSFIESHEDAALYSLVLSLATGALAFVALFFQNDPKRSRIINICVVLAGAIAMASLGYTASLGGQIRHSEFRSADASASSEAGSPRMSEDNEDHD